MDAGLEPPSALSATAEEIVAGTADFECNKANAHFLRGEFEAALEGYTSALDKVTVDAQLVRLLSNRSATYVAMGRIVDFKNALRDAERIVDLQPDWPRGWYRKGIALRSIAKFASAERAFQHGLRLALASAGSGGSDDSAGVDEAALAAAAASGYSTTGGAAISGVAAQILQFRIALSELERMAAFENGGVGDGPSAVASTSGSTSTLPAGGSAGGASTYRDVPDSEVLGEEAEDMDTFRMLEDWLVGRGKSQFPYLYMRRYGEGSRGVHMRTDVPSETEVMAIGLEYLITVEMGRGCPMGRRLHAAGIDRDLSASKHCYLSLFVMWDRRNPSSFFKPYYDILPQSYPNMPIFWDAAELEYLSGSYLLQQIEDRKANIKADYEAIW